MEMMYFTARRVRKKIVSVLGLGAPGFLKL